MKLFDLYLQLELIRRSLSVTWRTTNPVAMIAACLFFSTAASHSGCLLTAQSLTLSKLEYTRMIPPNAVRNPASFGCGIDEVLQRQGL
eukprot:CAMPEP_0181227372 /NCGR_PEP_ID=MMETSP1096-20121128/32753_1 /TAXON_ID=156174 ORGANISM="Chrysochromulina ericina, Strain CCMP281" /NCGR_SAMPLE_ID=MMETSP1096 /ASSEMBLY_ACC=CAM_ASM_000453 /LENGTH=87 /DNA_ID=CAMNT_0023320773 /DNA_START=622 /DNA_END=883 /DNA_ORIENTATION=+